MATTSNETQREGGRQSRGLWCCSRGRYELRAATLAPAPGALIVRSLASAVSRGTERLVLQGAVPASEHERMRAPNQQGAFPFPVLYGYQNVGLVEEGPDEWRGRLIFALQPHQDCYALPVSAAVPVPDAMPPARAALAANMETALNALWDAGAGPGQRIAVVGGGIVGLFVASLAARMPGCEVVLIDPLASRAAVAAPFGVRWQADAAELADADLVFHASASEAGLAAALTVAGTEATVIELSWYGDKPVRIGLGGAFHSRRLRLVASQVGAVAPAQRPRWPHARRLAKALMLLDDARYDAFVTHTIPFAEAPERLPALLAPEQDALGIVLQYS